MTVYVLREIRAVRELVGDCCHQAIRKMIGKKPDFQVNGYRFIARSKIADTLVAELEDDPYVVGERFDAELLAKVTGWPQALIEVAQDAEAFEIIGQAIIDADLV